MEWLQGIIDRFAQAFKWFYILQPWEQALRVRFGKWITKHNGGLHFRIPYIDYIFKQNTRLRLSEIPSMTVTTTDGKTITLSGALQYRVHNVEPLYTKLHMAENTIARQTQGIISRFIALNDLEDCGPYTIIEVVEENVNLERYGLAEVEFILKDYAVVRTYRLITGDVDSWNDHALLTDEAIT